MHRHPDTISVRSKKNVIDFQPNWPVDTRLVSHAKVIVSVGFLFGLMITGPIARADDGRGANRELCTLQGLEDWPANTLPRIRPLDSLIGAVPASYHAVVQVSPRQSILIDEDAQLPIPNREIWFDQSLNAPGENTRSERVAQPVVDLPEKKISSITLDISLLDDEVPENQASRVFSGHPQDPAVATREWPATLYTWQAPALAHNPLYFEEINLERHGYSFGMLQPAISAAHFFGRAVALPYLMTLQPPRQCVYTLGYRRPGSCVPYYVHRLPWNPRAAAVQAAVVTGAVLVIP